MTHLCHLCAKASRDRQYGTLQKKQVAYLHVCLCSLSIAFCKGGGGLSKGVSALSDMFCNTIVN